MSQPDQQQDKNIVVSRETSRIERLETIVIMVAGVGISQILLWGMIFEYTFSWHLFLWSLVTGPGALAWGLANYKSSRFWDSYYGKRIMFRSTK